MNKTNIDSGSPSFTKGTKTRTGHHKSNIEDLDHRKRGSTGELLRGDE